MNTLDVQLRLIELGLLKGSPDGIKGPRTIRSIRTFQRMYGLKSDGIVGPRTEAVLWPPGTPSRDEPDPKAPPGPRPAAGAPTWPRQKDVAAFYGARGENQVMLQVPYKMLYAGDRRKVIRQFSIHERAHDSALRALTRIAATDAELRSAVGADIFGGCLNVRLMTGSSTTWSMHSWGIAIDFDPARNGFTSKRANARFAQKDAEWFLDAWEAEGWLSLGRARDMDWMHVQAARL